jgi:hypothetical protein
LTITQRMADALLKQFKMKKEGASTSLQMMYI